MPEYLSGLALTAGVLALAEAVRKTLVNRQFGRERSRDYLAIAMACMGCASVASAPIVARWADRVFDARNVAFYIASSATMLTVLALSGFLRAVGVTGLRVRTIVAAGLVCLTAMTMFYLMDGISEPGFGRIGDNRPSARLYNVIFHGAVAAGLVVFIDRTAAEIRRVDRALRIALALAIAGMAIGVVPVLWKLGLVLIGGTAEPRYMAITLHMSGLSVITFAAGSAAAAVARSVADFCQLKRSRRRDRAIHNLWKLLDDAGVQRARTLVSTGSSARERALSIREAQRALQPFVPPGVAELARAEAENQGWSTEQVAVFVEAVELRTALVAFAAGRTFDQVERNADLSFNEVIIHVDEDEELDGLAALGRIIDHNAAVDAATQKALRRLVPPKREG